MSKPRNDFGFGAKVDRILNVSNHGEGVSMIIFRLD